ncbi:hypothetical protein [Jannaschia sp. R86511]|uniref:hypothetical protein n=1 Tax=Jannaschia sp. R86511 TaxID=3093853 RepID=UPI0036D27B83
MTDVSCLEGSRESGCVLRWVNDAGLELSAGLVGAEGVDVGDVVTVAPEDPAGAPENWAERAEAATPGGTGRVMLLGPMALFADIALPLVLAAGCAIGAAATWGRWTDETTGARSSGRPPSA